MINTIFIVYASYQGYISYKSLLTGFIPDKPAYENDLPSIRFNSN